MSANDPSMAARWWIARTGESGSLCTDRKRDTTASREGFVATANSCVNSGNPSDRSMRHFRLLFARITAFGRSQLPYIGKWRVSPQSSGAEGGSAVHYRKKLRQDFSRF